MRSNELYHYTTASNLLAILMSDRLKCSQNRTGNQKYKFCLSTTRTPSAFDGYGADILERSKKGNDTAICRITLDADILKLYFYVSPIDWATMQTDKNDIYSTKYAAIKSANDADAWVPLKRQFDVETEERVYSNTQFINTCSKYIKSIDIIKSQFIKKDFDYLVRVLRQRDNNIKLNVFPDKKSFELNANTTGKYVYSSNVIKIR